MIGEWRKQENVHSWMHDLWLERSEEKAFNYPEELGLTKHDLNRLEMEISDKTILQNEYSVRYPMRDYREFFKEAHDAVDSGNKVGYRCC